MVKEIRKYIFCEGCERRMFEDLMVANRCRGCHSDTKRKLLRKESFFTEEDMEVQNV